MRWAGGLSWWAGRWAGLEGWAGGLACWAELAGHPDDFFGLAWLVACAGGWWAIKNFILNFERPMVSPSTTRPDRRQANGLKAVAPPGPKGLGAPFALAIHINSIHIFYTYV